MVARYLVYACVFIQALLCAQPGSTTALRERLVKHTADTIRVIDLYTLCQEQRQLGDYRSSLAFGKQSLQLAKELKYSAGMMNAYTHIANSYFGLSNFDEAINCHNASMKIRTERHDKKGIAETLHNLGVVYDKKGEYDLALQSYSASLVIDEDIEDWHNAIITYNNIGVIYERRGDYTNAISNYCYALAKINSKSGQDVAASFNEYQNIGNAYLHQRKYDEALKEYNASLVFEQNRKNNQGIADSYNNLGVVSCYQRKFRAALNYHASSLDIKEKIGDKQGMAVSYINLANVHKRQQNYIKALELQYQALSVYTMVGDKHGICVSYILLGETQSFLNKPLDAERFLNKAMELSKELKHAGLVMETYRGFARLNNVLSVRRGQSLKSKEAYMMKAINYYTLWVTHLDSTSTKATLFDYNDSEMPVLQE